VGDAGHDQSLAERRQADGSGSRQDVLADRTITELGTAGTPSLIK
jgi:hypothetical protein